MKKSFRSFCLILIAMMTLSLITLTSCKKEELFSDAGTVTDVDGNVYHAIKIGTQIWMTENLKTTRYRNGDSIPNVTSGSIWNNLNTGAYCNFNNDNEIAKIYGRLYNSYAVFDKRNLAPKGWHVSTETEWNTLVTYLGGFKTACEKLKESGNAHWKVYNDGTNTSGFTALPAGYREPDTQFGGIGENASWWCSNSNASHPYIDNDSGFNFSTWLVNPTKGNSVRCIKDLP